MDIQRDVLARFLRYARIDTQARDGTEDYPSTPGQLDLLRLLSEELRGLGLADVELDEHGYVTATLEANTPGPQPTIGLLAHVDTYHEVSGKGVQPILHADYRGGPIRLPKNDLTIDPADNPDLESFAGDTIVTSDGSTLLGADDKAGVAEIMTLLAWYRAEPNRPHPRIRVGFTPDEEVGNGTKFFDIQRFGADVAYTQDGAGVGEVEDETFCADTAIVTITGADVHPGYAKGKMVNAVRLAAAFIERIDRRALPETTALLEPYIHPFQVQGSVSEARITCLVRAFTLTALRELEAGLERIRHEVLALEPRARIAIEIKESYRNMKEVLDLHPHVTAFAEDAMRAVGIEPKRKAIRGGTDGARLSFMGLPTPNLSAGGYNFHSLTEWLPVGAMVKAVRVLDALMKIWVTRGATLSP